MNHGLTKHPSHSTTHSSAPQKLMVELANRSYPIYIGSDLLANPLIFADVPSASQAVIVSNQTVATWYLSALHGILKEKYPTVIPIVIPDGEEYKNLTVFEQVISQLLEHTCDRKTVLFALGGGVVGDLTGFVAACYMRGVPYIQIPTSLLAQVDSSVGGKTAINHTKGKNMVGAFYQPAMVVCDLKTLLSLPKREYLSGLAEVVKYGAIMDMRFFSWLEAHIEPILNMRMPELAFIVERSCRIKAQIVAMDETENHIRAWLNFGHTVAHAIEVGLGYGQWLHGEAVACGMVVETYIAQSLGLVTEHFVERLKHLLQAFDLPTSLPQLPAEDYLSIMRLDKKSIAGNIQFALVDGQGKASVVSVKDQDIYALLQTLLRA
ncbi:MAG: 3-dehydroquinate synthase [Gammaproteobacteria bacterium]|nr:3-dehydroquinate synthase [Gammaproteobacteria bacterium]